MASVGLKSLRALLVEARRDLSALLFSPPEHVIQTSEPSQVPEGLKTGFHGQALVNESAHRFRIIS
jgi:hypothetical protein